ncbi:hypothetical protein A2U01_0088006, partial [Trifolium medium]|nr:hypothetical protein [Trifolium medium]
TLCRLEHVPTWEDDEIAPAEQPLGRTFFQRAVRDLQAVQAAAAAPQPPPQLAAQQHQSPPHMPHQHQYSDFELGMVASMYDQY